ncbi:type II toxin-antitoxin system antitoxin SocA domain-containing protein [Fructilactobacillus florum]|uniref:type II toxin-antitoxin system antitoxin SocA domain-containing protein n=1 Tax=Fructilactobacillus florum TaxID=640331 RepID=UPI0006CF34D4|nr:type II toxin-antitoxin system antitoxin SocA domain-containing protein [Fructilactobacillus florum]
MYFVWAFYAATYGNVDTNESEIKDSDVSYPEHLFEPNFEAWKYGPVDPDVWENNNGGNIEPVNLDNVDSLINISNKSVINDILSFVDDMINQVKDVNDFGLVNRSHEDSAWRDVWKDNFLHIKMDPAEIKKRLC